MFRKIVFALLSWAIIAAAEFVPKLKVSEIAAARTKPILRGSKKQLNTTESKKEIHSTSVKISDEPATTKMLASVKQIKPELTEAKTETMHASVRKTSSLSWLAEQAREGAKDLSTGLARKLDLPLMTMHGLLKLEAPERDRLLESMGTSKLVLQRVDDSVKPYIAADIPKLMASVAQITPMEPEELKVVLEREKLTCDPCSKEQIVQKIADTQFFRATFLTESRHHSETNATNVEQHVAPVKVQKHNEHAFSSTCHSHCYEAEKPFQKKCKWRHCVGCLECGGDAAMPVLASQESENENKIKSTEQASESQDSAIKLHNGVCAAACYNARHSAVPWEERKCNWRHCGGCQECHKSQTLVAVTHPRRQTKSESRSESGAKSKAKSNSEASKAKSASSSETKSGAKLKAKAKPESSSESHVTSKATPKLEASKAKSASSSKTKSDAKLKAKAKPEASKAKAESSSESESYVKSKSMSKSEASKAKSESSSKSESGAKSGATLMPEAPPTGFRKTVVGKVTEAASSMFSRLTGFFRGSVSDKVVGAVAEEDKAVPELTTLEQADKDTEVEEFEKATEQGKSTQKSNRKKQVSHKLVSSEAVETHRLHRSSDKPKKAVHETKEYEATLKTHKSSHESKTVVQETKVPQDTAKTHKPSHEPKVAQKTNSHEDTAITRKSKHELKKVAQETTDPKDTAKSHNARHEPKKAVQETKVSEDTAKTHKANHESKTVVQNTKFDEDTAKTHKAKHELKKVAQETKDPEDTAITHKVSHESKKVVHEPNASGVAKTHKSNHGPKEDNATHDWKAAENATQVVKANEMLSLHSETPRTLKSATPTPKPAFKNITKANVESKPPVLVAKERSADEQNVSMQSSASQDMLALEKKKKKKKIEASNKIGKLPEVTAILSNQSQVLQAFNAQVGDLKNHLAAAEAKNRKAVAEQKAEYEIRLKIQHENTTKILKVNEQIGSEITSLKDKNAALRAKAKSLQAKMDTLNQTMINLKAKISIAQDFIANSLSRDIDDQSKLAVLSELAARDLAANEKKAHDTALATVSGSNKKLSLVQIGGPGEINQAILSYISGLQQKFDDLDREQNSSARSLYEDFNSQFTAENQVQMAASEEQQRLLQSKQTETELHERLIGAVQHLESLVAELEAKVESLRTFAERVSR